MIVLIVGFIALVYQVVSLIASLVFRGRAADAWEAWLTGSGEPPRDAPGVSILKPVRGLDEGFWEGISSHAREVYPRFEILFGVESLDDPAVPLVRRLMAEHPDIPIQLIVVDERTPNAKVGVLAALVGHAQYPVLLVNDSDITVPPDYLSRVVAPLADPAVGLVTCLYRARASSNAGRWKGLGIATDFIPSTLVAPMVGVQEFGLGSTLCFRREDLDQIGGFDAFSDYIADDYQLSRRITQLGKRIHLSNVIVTTHLSNPNWKDVWRHQVRWARTIRVSRADGFAGLPITHAGLWALIAAVNGLGWVALWLVAARMASGIASGIGVLRQRELWPLIPLIPLWDLWAFLVWIASWSGDTVTWRGRSFRLLRDGRLEPLS